MGRKLGERTPSERAPSRVPSERARIAAVLDGLAAAHPDARCPLVHDNPFELLVATILSAQTTDRMVNQVTPPLFRRAPTPAALAGMDHAELEDLIRRIGLYRNKAAHLLAAARMLVAEFGGEVPRTLEQLTRLPGVGRKTAAVVLADGFGLPAIAVDTHVFRVANRLGLARARTPEETERQLRKVIPRTRWRVAHHWLIFHGRRVCHARRPRCAECPVHALCYTEAAGGDPHVTGHQGSGQHADAPARRPPGGGRPAGAAGGGS